MSIEKTRETMLRFIKSEHGDVSMLADDVVFIIMATGEEHRGRKAVQELFNYLYHIAFDATAKLQVAIFSEDNAAIEYNFEGKHIGEFSGIPASGKDVQVPLCVIYDVENSQIKRARVYFETPALLTQLGIPMGYGLQTAYDI